MAGNRTVTERDMRMPEFRDCEPADLEFRDDGALVRKDRWERGIRLIAGIVDITGRQEFDIADVSMRVINIKMERDALLNAYQQAAADDIWDEMKNPFD